MSVIVDLRVDEDDGVPWLVCEDTDGQWLFHTELDSDQMRELYSRVGAWLQSISAVCPECNIDHLGILRNLTPTERATL